MCTWLESLDGVQHSEMETMKQGTEYAMHSHLTWCVFTGWKAGWVKRLNGSE